MTNTEAPLRQEVLRLLRLISSVDLQVQYENDVPIADVPGELVCQWFDDLYHPKSTLFQAAFSEVERARLAGFNEFYESRVKMLPKTLAELHRSSAWREIQVEAARTLDDLASQID
jgi:hypothetical protein